MGLHQGSMCFRVRGRDCQRGFGSPESRRYEKESVNTYSLDELKNGHTRPPLLASGRLRNAIL